MKLHGIFTLVIICLLASCVTFEGKDKNYLSDVSIDANKLSCDGILMTNYTGSINKSEFVYGEAITILYDNMTGFTLKDSLVYPEMDIFVINKKGDTIMSQPELFKNKIEGHTETDLNLRSLLTLSKPMLPNNEYVMTINISDKNSDAYFNFSRNFSIIQDPNIKTNQDGLTYDVQYLFSESTKAAVLDSKIKRNELLYLLIEDLEGYKVDAYGQADIHASVNLTDSRGKVINKNDNLFPNLVNAADLKEQLFASVQLTDGTFSSPLTYTIKIKDNNSDHYLETTFNLTVED